VAQNRTGDPDKSSLLKSACYAALSVASHDLGGDSVRMRRDTGPMCFLTENTWQITQMPCLTATNSALTEIPLKGPMLRCGCRSFRPQKL